MKVGGFFFFFLFCSCLVLRKVPGTEWRIKIAESVNRCSCCSVTQSCLTFCDYIDCSMPGFPVLHSLPELAQTHVHWVSDAIHLSQPLSFPSPPAFSLSQHQGLFQGVSSFNRRPEYWSFSFSIRTSNEYSGLISFRIDWFDLAVQGTLKFFFFFFFFFTKPQFKSIDSSMLRFFMVQLSHPYKATGKTSALTRWTFVSKVMSLL